MKEKRELNERVEMNSRAALVSIERSFMQFSQKIETGIDPLHTCGNAANLEDKTKEIFASVKNYYCSVLQIGCIPTDVQGVYTSRPLHHINIIFQ